MVHLRCIVLCVLVVGAPELLRGAEAAEELKLAVEKLVSARTYAWKQTFSGPDYPIPPVFIGAAERDGVAVVTTKAGGDVSQSVRKGEYFSISQLPNGQWQTSDEAQARLTKQSGREFPRSTNPPRPAEDLQRLVPNLIDFARSGERITAKFNEAEVARRYTLGTAMKPTKTHQAEGTFWLKDGALVKYELRFDVDVIFMRKEEKRRPVIMVELSEIGTAKVELPAGAKAKLGSQNVER